MEGRLEAVKEIVQNLQPSWIFPLAIYFTSLIGSESPIHEGGAAIYDAFSSHFQSTFPDGFANMCYLTTGINNILKGNNR
ncbi:hypothetical protein N7449_009510 [Penicillium cf. viridicatum]|uniref:Uncharacterized protein n=1 Tax=Penicillium cf. viridicatum TaxID=2972119 RepID=A0A9W9JAX5_9EURO|nr:hypothetical protein N7449_009510 [Penicillium cf. viridicatum]